MRPQFATVARRQHFELVVDGNSKEAPVGDGRRAAQWRAHALAPDLLAGLRIERDDLRITGRDEDAILGKGDATAKGGPGILRLDIGVPDLSARLALDSADGRISIHGEELVAKGDRRRHDPTIARGAVADIGVPGGRNVLTERDVLHYVVGITTRLGPIGVDDRTRQPDFERCDLRIGLELLVETEHRKALTRQRRFRRIAGDQGERW